MIQPGALIRLASDTPETLSSASRVSVCRMLSSYLTDAICSSNSCGREAHSRIASFGIYLRDIRLSLIHPPYGARYGGKIAEVFTII